MIEGSYVIEGSKRWFWMATPPEVGKPYRHEAGTANVFAMIGASNLRRGVVAALLVCAASASPAAAAVKGMWGPVSQFATYHRLGASIYEADLPWASVAPVRPRRPQDPRDQAYRWPPELDVAVAQARRYHMRVLLQVIGAPGWANGGHAWDWAPKRPRDFADFTRAAARRYPSVHLWMIWGEPTRAGNFEPIVKAAPGVALNRAQRSAPHIYARLLDVAYGELKAVSRHNLVIGGDTYTVGLIDTEQWIANLKLPDGRPPRMDLYAHNPFGFREPSFSNPPSPFGDVDFSDLPRLTPLLDRYLRPGLRLFLSEFTIPTAPDNEFNAYVSEQTQALWISDALRLSRAWKRIYALGWIHLSDDPPATTGGLLRSDGSPKPGFLAFARG